MPQTVGQHGFAAFTSPSNGDALDATVVKSNDNTIRTAYTAHDTDPGIHFQSSTLASRPVAGVSGRKWMTTDAGVNKIWFDNGSTWEEASYITSLADLNASNLTSGTVPDGRFPATLPAASGQNLTALNASNLASGTVPDARFPATLPAASGANLTALNASNLASGTVPDARFPATLPVANGSNLTNLNASNLASGTVPDARFPATLPAASGANLTNLPAANVTGTFSNITMAGGGTANLQDGLLLRPLLRDYGEVRTAPTISGAALTLNIENGNVFEVTFNASITTLTISNPPANGIAGSFTLRLTADGTPRTITWPAAVKWPGGIAPQLTSTNGKVDIFVFLTTNAGTTWYAFTAGQNL